VRVALEQFRALKLERMKLDTEVDLFLKAETGDTLHNEEIITGEFDGTMMFDGLHKFDGGES
jgi:hypothetical protein